MAKAVCFDTNIFTHYRDEAPPKGSVLSAVVVMELILGAADDSEVKRWTAAFDAYAKEGRAIVPERRDYVMAGRVLYRLQQRRRAGNRGRTPPISKAEVQGIMRDVLIAVSVKRAGALLVTENVRDFQRIREVCPVTFQSGRDFFGYAPGRR